MSDLIMRVRCPYGCQHGELTESVKSVSKGPDANLLTEAPNGSTVQEKIKVYHCQECQHSFETPMGSLPSGKTILE